MIDSLPTELVTRICEHLSKAELTTISQTSRSIHKTAAGVLYRDIVLLSRKLPDLEEAISRWTSILDRRKLWSAPRSVTVTTSPISRGDSIRNGSDSLYATIKLSIAPECQKNSEANGLVAFLRNLPSLSSLVWQSEAPPAPSVRSLLQNELTTCELHLKGFHLPYQPDLQHLRSLLSLRNLRTIWFQHMYENNLQGLLQRIVQNGISNLVEVRMLHSYHPSCPLSDGESPISWDEDEEPVPSDEHPLGRLRTLELAGMQPQLHRDLRAWTRAVAFSHLSRLGLHIVVTRSDLEVLHGQRMSSLDSLVMALDDSDTSDEYATMLQSFLCSLPVLANLRLVGGCLHSCLSTALPHHRKTLRTLYLVPSGVVQTRSSFTSSTIAYLVDACGALKELGITVVRRWNVPGEDLTVLRAIGRLPQLTILDLTFDASDYSSEGPITLSFISPEDPEGQIRNALINSAVDVDLAKAVFETVAFSNSPNGREGTGEPSFVCSRLRRMSIKSIGGGDFGIGIWDDDLCNTAAEMGRRLVVEACRRDNDVALKLRHTRGPVDRDELMETLAWNIEPVFQSIWPNQGGDWFDEWHAFPLKGIENK